jgi:flagellar protein FlaF
MTLQRNAARGYSQINRQTGSDRQIELQLFSRITAKLRVQDRIYSGFLTADLAQALVENARLWNLIFIDLSNAENRLPVALKASLIELSEFTQYHTQEVLRGEADFGVLIDINTNIINGLKQSLSPKRTTSTIDILEPKQELV